MSTARPTLRSQVGDGLVAGREPLHLSWSVVAPVGENRQLGYEIETASDSGFSTLLATSGVVAGDEQVAVAAPGETLRTRETRHLRVRIETEAGWTDWSRALRVEAGLLNSEDWVAEAVTLPDDAGADRQSPSPILRKVFGVERDVVRARLHVTSLGVHQVMINGRPVSDSLLAPGWTTYHHRLLADTHDVASMLQPGANVIHAVLGDGWYRGRLGWEPGRDRCHYGRDLGLIAQLELDLADGSRQVIATDGTWQASTGEIRSADLYDGSLIDLRKRQTGWERPDFDDSGWLPAAVVPFDRFAIEPRATAPVRMVDVLPATSRATGAGRTSLDGGQNIAGFVRLTVRGKPGDRVIVRHAEVLEPDGSLHVRSLRSAKATDAYVLADGEPTTLEPAFTFHGFRFAEVETDAELLDAEFVVISSDLPRRGMFACSDPTLSRFYENVVWSQRDNFVSVPTDCPQRDERLGWTGDAQAFAPTASVLFDSEAFWTSWLKDLALDQDDVLGVSTVVPDVVLRDEPRFGRAGWADAATIVPWAVYESYGDLHVLRAQFDSMCRWIDSLAARRSSDGLLGTSMQFGDWLDPDAPSDRPWEAKASSDYVANAFFANSARLVADASLIAGHANLEPHYRALAKTVGELTWLRWAEHAMTTQTGCAVALQLQIAPETDRERVASALARLVRDADGRVATGFLGTPLVLPALIGAGFVDESYQMLLRRDPPSWLYQVGMGATTVWERWDAIRPDGSIHPGTMAAPPEMPDSGEGHMLSFNHYAYGAVVDWVFRHVAGLAPDITQPGYRHVVFAPRPAVGIDWARASVESAFGDVKIAWNLQADASLAVEIELPFGTTGEFRAPTTAKSAVLLAGSTVAPIVRLGPGRSALTVTAPAVAQAADRLRATVS